MIYGSILPYRVVQGLPVSLLAFHRFQAVWPRPYGDALKTEADHEDSQRMVGWRSQRSEVSQSCKMTSDSNISRQPHCILFSRRFWSLQVQMTCRHRSLRAQSSPSNQRRGGAWAPSASYLHRWCTVCLCVCVCVWRLTAAVHGPMRDLPCEGPCCYRNCVYCTSNPTIVNCPSSFKQTLLVLLRI